MTGKETIELAKTLKQTGMETDLALNIAYRMRWAGQTEALAEWLMQNPKATEREICLMAHQLCKQKMEEIDPEMARQIP